MISYAETAVFVSSPKSKTLIFRGQLTPQWSEDFARRKVALWRSLLEERGTQVTIDRTRRLPLIPIGEEEAIDLNNRIQLALLKQLARTYDLVVFKCPLRENIASLFDCGQH